MIYTVLSNRFRNPTNGSVSRFKPQMVNLPMPEVTVSMPAFNTADYIGAAIRSVLAQEDVDLELIVVDDASDDNTVDIVKAFRDPRMRLLRNTERRGISFCHNRILDRSTSPFIAHVDSDDLILPGALRKLLDAVGSDPAVGQAHCHFIRVDRDGRTTRELYRRLFQHLSKRNHGIDYRQELMIGGSVMNALRTYRREVFDSVGRFNEELRWHIDHEMGLRIADRYRFALVPEFLYCTRVHGTNTTATMRFKEPRFFLQRIAVWRAVMRGNRDHFLRKQPFGLAGLIAGRLRRLSRDAWRALSPGPVPPFDPPLPNGVRLLPDGETLEVEVPGEETATR